MHNFVACAVSRKHWQPAVRRGEGFFGDSCFHTFSAPVHVPSSAVGEAHTVIDIIYTLHSTCMHMHILTLKTHLHAYTHNIIYSHISCQD